MASGGQAGSETTEYEFSTDNGRLDLEAIHAFLVDSYWSPGIPRETVELGIENSLCFGVYRGAEQVGFARAVSDFASFAYLADLYILEGHRGQGLSKRLMRTILDHPKLRGLRRFMLATRDAHGLYAQFDFESIADMNMYMERLNRGSYPGRERNE